MLGFDKCLICKQKMTYDSAIQAQKNGWYKLVLRKDYQDCNGRGVAKFQGMICPECVPVVLDFYYDIKEDTDDRSEKSAPTN